MGNKKRIRTKYTPDRRRQISYNASWKENNEVFRSWLCPVKNFVCEAYCNVCEKVFPVSHGGLYDVTMHAKTKRHILLQTRRETSISAGELSPPDNLEYDKKLKKLVQISNPPQMRKPDRKILPVSLKYLQYRQHLLNKAQKQNLRDKIVKRQRILSENRNDNVHAVSSKITIKEELDYDNLFETEEFNPVNNKLYKDGTDYPEDSNPEEEQYDTDDFTTEPSLSEKLLLNSVKISPKRETVTMLPQQYCLRWKYHHSNLQTMFSQLLERGCFCDVTLACDGQMLKAHRVVLSACSTYFDTILTSYDEKDPILIMKDVKFEDVKCLVEFMYKGEINVDHCNLASLLKTAEDLHIKGLAEVSWRDEDNAENGTGDDSHNNIVNTSNVKTELGNQTPPNKRKRGRPQMEEYDDGPKITSVVGSANFDTSTSSNLVSVMLDDPDENAEENANWMENNYDRDTMDYDDDEEDDDDDEDDDDVEQIIDSDPLETNNASSPDNQNGSQSESQPEAASTSQQDPEWSDVIKMNDYLTRGRRPQFWEEPFTRRVMDAIKNKDVEMKKAAEILGVSYGTLYGRYRDTYGCLKHPYRVRDMWSEQGPAEILGMLQRKIISLPRAAELLNVPPISISSYLDTLKDWAHENDPSHSNAETSGGSKEPVDRKPNLLDGNPDISLRSISELRGDSPEKRIKVEKPDIDDNISDHKDIMDKDIKIGKNITISTKSNKTMLDQKTLNDSSTTGLLENHPDITIINIKKENKPKIMHTTSERVNNNSSSDLSS